MDSGDVARLLPGYYNVKFIPVGFHASTTIPLSTIIECQSNLTIPLAIYPPCCNGERHISITFQPILDSTSPAGSLVLNLQSSDITEKMYVALSIVMNHDVTGNKRNVIIDKMCHYFSLVKPGDVDSILARSFCCPPNNQDQREMDLLIGFELTLINAFEMSKRVGQSYVDDTKLMSDAVEMFKNQSYITDDCAEIKIMGDVDESTVRIPKSLVCNASEIMKERFGNGTKGLYDGNLFELAGYSPNHVWKFLTCLVTGVLQGCGSLKEKFDMLEIADEYSVTWLKTDTAVEIVRVLDVGNIFDIYSAGLHCNDQLIQDTCFELCMFRFDLMELNPAWGTFKQSHTEVALHILDHLLGQLKDYKCHSCKFILPDDFENPLLRRGHRRVQEF